MQVSAGTGPSSRTFHLGLDSNRSAFLAYVGLGIGIRVETGENGFDE
jgi:hypothetical protein